MFSCLLVKFTGNLNNYGMKYLLLLLSLISISTYGQNTVSVNELIFQSPSTGSQSFTINTTGSWDLSYTGDWANITGPFSGTGDATIPVDLLYDNQSKTDWKAEDIIVQIVIGTPGFYTTIMKTVTIKQEPVPAIMSLTETNLSLGFTGQLYSIDLTSDADWSANSDNNWLTFQPSYTTQLTGNSGTTTIDLAISNNTTASQRIGTVTFTAGITSVTFVVTQEDELTTDILETVNENDFVAYPNPSTGIVNIHSKAATGIIIFDSKGTLIQARESNTSHVFELPKGLYFLRTEGNLTQKLIIE